MSKAALISVTTPIMSKGFTESGFNEDLTAIAVPVLLMHDDDDRIVLCPDTASLYVELVRTAH